MPTDETLTALLASDLAQEVRSEFNAQLGIGFGIADATRHVFGHFSDALADSHTGPVVILALAAMQLREQQLHPVVRDAALDLIESGEAAAAFPTATVDARKGRRALLEQFAIELQQATVCDDSNENDERNGQ